MFAKSDSKGSYIWNFPFTDSQIDEIENMENNYRDLYFIFVCGRKSLNKSRIAVVPKNVIFQCVDFKRIQKYKSQSIKIRLIKGHWDFNIYGTARADKINGHNNTLKVRTNSIDEFFGR